MSAVPSIFDTPVVGGAAVDASKRPAAENGPQSGEKQSKKSKKASKKQLIDLLVQEHVRELSQNDSSESTTAGPSPKKKKKQKASAANGKASPTKNANVVKKKPKAGLKIKLHEKQKLQKSAEAKQHAPDALVETSFDGESLKNNSNHSTPVTKNPKKKNKPMPQPFVIVTPKLPIKQEPQTPKPNGLQAARSTLDSTEVGREQFAWVISPTPVDEFMANYWEKKPLLIQRKNQAYYKNLLSRAKIDEMLRQHNIEYTKNIDVTSYREGQRETHNPDGRVLPPDMWSFYEEGCSIRMLNPQTYLPGVYEMNVKLQEFFHCMTGANFYLTPPNSQGFAPHYDDIEAFVLQVEGRKHWKLYSPREPAEFLARVSSPNFTQEEIGNPILEVVLEPGDLLYFPRGIIHQASTVPGHHSLHVTMSVYQKNCWADLLEVFFPQALAQAAEAHFDLRRGIPLDLHNHFGIVHSDSETPTRKQLIAHIKALVDKVFSEEAIDSAVDQLAKRFQHDALPPMVSPSEQSSTVYGSSFDHNPDGTVSLRVPFTENSTVRLLRRNVLRLVSEEDKLRIYYHTDNSHELDSYMYQTVGHQGIEKLAQAMELPLYRKITRGNSINTKGNYEPTEDDEVEDLYELLRQVKEEQNVEAVAVGAILSDYQRVRVENVCNRLQLISLAYLWRRDQTELLQEMIDCQVYAIIIKVAALGLIPDRHLGKSLKEMQPHLLNMKDKYGLNVCGEGGEYETFTLDCPLFKSRIVVDDVQTVISSADPVCPVGYLNFTKLRLVPKERVETVVVKNSLDFIADLNESSYSDLSDPDLSETELELIEKVTNAKVATTMRNSFSKDDLNTATDGIGGVSRSNSITKDFATEVIQLPRSPVKIITKRLSVDGNDSGGVDGTKLVYKREREPLTNQPRAIVNSKGWMWVAGVQGVAETSSQAMEIALQTLEDLITSNSFTLRQICYITLYVRDMNEYCYLNEIYSNKFSFTNPPTRVCVECPLPENCHVVLEAVAFNSEKSISELEHKRHTMHVQGISHWAPANIGTYSQSTKVGHITYISGQIALVPGSMTIVEGGIKQQCKLTLRHVSRIAKAMHAQGQLRDVVQGICFVTHPSYISEARRQWERRTANAIMDYIVVPALPRGALVEWQVWAHTHNDKFDYEETGCSIGDYSISIRRRWNYENNCASVVCYVSTGLATSTTKLAELSDDFLQHHNQLAQSISREQIHDTIAYVLRKLLQDYPVGISPTNESGSSSSDEQNNHQNNHHNHQHHHHPHYHHQVSHHRTTTDGSEPATADSGKPTVHLRFFYQVSAIGSVQSLVEAIESFLSLPSNTARIAYTVVPACHLQNFSTFISICGLRHHE